MTKRQKCLEVLTSYCAKAGKTIQGLGFSDMIMSSSVAVAMEYLKLIPEDKHEMKEYARQMGGIISVDWNGQKGIPIVKTLRDELATLPD